MKRITQTNEIQSGDNSGILFSGNEKAAYSQDFTLEEFEGNDLITLNAANELISGSTPVPTLSTWVDGETAMEDDYRTHPIDGIEYLFRSKFDDNTTEPTLTGTAGAWTQTDIYGLISTWTSFVSYNEGNLVTGDANTNIYRSKVNGNEGNNPNGGLNPEEWELVGAYRGFYSSGGLYDVGDVVVVAAEANRIYISNIADNEQPLTDISSSSWVVIGAPGGGGGSAGDPTTGTIEAVDSPLVITWDTDLVPGDTEGRTYLEKHGALEFVTVQMTMPDPANEGDMTPFASWRFDEGTKNTLTIDNQGQFVYYTIGYGANGTSGGGGGDLTLGETSTTAYRGDRGKTAYDHSQTAGNPHGTAIGDIPGLETELNSKVTQVGAKVLSDENYTSTEKTKLANLNNYFVGTYATYSALVSAHPVGLPGQYAVIDSLIEDARIYTWDDTNDDWVQGNKGQVSSVNGQVGPVSLDTDDIGEGATNKYWTLARTVGSVLTGFVGGSTHVAILATDSIMQALQKVYGSLESIITTLAFKSSIAASTGTSTALTFGFDSVQGTPSSPLTGDITGSTSGAFLGVTVLVIHNSGFAPTFDSKFKKLSGSGDYVPTETNYIYCQYIDSTTILYSINQLA